MKTGLLVVILAALLATGQSPAYANLITNGNFAQLASGVSSPGAHICDNGPAAGATCASNILGWQATCSGHGCAGTNSPGSILLNGTSGNGWNGNTGYSSYFGLYGTIGNAPGGGNAIAIDGDSSYTQSISQTVLGLTPGSAYSLSFFQAAAQQKGLSGATTEQWQVTLGSDTQTSALMQNASKGYVDWNVQVLTFTATATSEVLKFLALGTPNGQPPVVLLSNVNLTLAPEPMSLSILGLGLAGLAVARRRRWGVRLGERKAVSVR